MERSVRFETSIEILQIAYIPSNISDVSFSWMYNKHMYVRSVLSHLDEPVDLKTEMQ